MPRAGLWRPLALLRGAVQFVVFQAALAVIDMVKGRDRGAHIAHVRLERKEGGRSGTWTRDA